MYLDADGRLCAYEQYTYFVTKGENGDFPPYRFLPWDLYNGETEEAEKAHTLQRIRQAFEPAVQAHWAEDVLAGFPITTRFPSVRQSRWPGCCFPASMP